MSQGPWRAACGRGCTLTCPCKTAEFPGTPGCQALGPGRQRSPARFLLLPRLPILLSPALCPYLGSLAPSPYLSSSPVSLSARLVLSVSFSRLCAGLSPLPAMLSLPIALACGSASPRLFTPHPPGLAFLLSPIPGPP